jgi:hypothetical protein
LLSLLCGGLLRFIIIVPMILFLCSVNIAPDVFRRKIQRVHSTPKCSPCQLFITNLCNR